MLSMLISEEFEFKITFDTIRLYFFHDIGCFADRIELMKAINDMSF